MENKVLFWDFDGTLVHPNERFIDTFKRSCEEVEIPRDDIKAKFVEIYPWLNYDIIYPEEKHLWWDNFFGSIAPLYEKWGIPMKKADIINERFKNLMINDNTYTIYEDAESTLRECKKRGYKNYILSNNYPELERVVIQFGIRNLFEEVIVSSNVGFEKPRRELFSYALERAGNPDVAYMIGDNPIADIKGGLGAGLKTVLVHRHDSPDADYICSTLEELLDIIK